MTFFEKCITPPQGFQSDEIIIINIIKYYKPILVSNKKKKINILYVTMGILK